MLRFSHSAVGVQQGSELLFTAYEDDGPMWAGTGPRAERRVLTFPEAFLGVPVVHVGLAMWDIAGDTNQRADLSVEAVTAQGFTVLFRTWGDTRVARVRINWLAIGPAAHLDDFDLD